MILDLIANNSVCIITSTPGSGKTSQIPQYILDSETENRRYCNIVVTQPRKIAAISIARYVSECRGLEVGTVIGHQVGLDKRHSPDTRLLYCTTGILLQKLIQAKSLNNYTHVILDEAHDRVKDMDFLFLIVRKFIRTLSSHVKVIIMSATMNVDEAASYFATFKSGVQRTPPVLCIDEPTYEVEVLYPENIPELKSLDSEDGCLEPRFDKTITEQIITSISYIEQRDGIKRNAKDKRGTILIFLPGYQEIMTVDSEISRCFDSSHGFDVLPVHSEIAITDQWRIFKPSPEGRRKIILATNIAESSITVPDVKFVIDPCMTKEIMTDERTGYIGLLLVWASKSSCDQRKGRCGRLSNGMCIRLVSMAFYENLANIPSPEFSRTPLESVVLYAKMMDLGPPGKVLSLAMTPPSDDAVRQSMFRLFELGGLVPLSTTIVQNFEDGELSFIGRLMASLPISVNLSKLIALGYVFGILDYCIIIAATSSVRQIFRFPYGDRLNLLRYKNMISGGSCSEMISGLNVFTQWLKHHELGILNSYPERKRFAKRHMIDLKRMEEAHRLYDDIKARLKRLDIYFPMSDESIVEEWTTPHSEIKHDQSSVNCLLLKIAIAGACYPNYFTMSPSNERELERFLNCRNVNNCVKIQRLPSQNLKSIELNVQRALETTYSFQNLRCEFESNK
ncbi:hypothetical protein GJ496_001151 [Pomphorhynchus laevis]|nr:hypothetical protein GJ496_001151 [Pomphorhynchus laevis]